MKGSVSAEVPTTPASDDEQASRPTPLLPDKTSSLRAAGSTQTYLDASRAICALARTEIAATNSVGRARH